MHSTAVPFMLQNPSQRPTAARRTTGPGRQARAAHPATPPSSPTVPSTAIERSHRAPFHWTGGPAPSMSQAPDACRGGAARESESRNSKAPSSLQICSDFAVHQSESMHAGLLALFDRANPWLLHTVCGCIKHILHPSECTVLDLT